MTRIYTLKNEVRSGHNVSIRRKLRSQNRLLVQLVFAVAWESFSMAFATVRTDDLCVVVFFSLVNCTETTYNFRYIGF